MAKNCHVFFWKGETPHPGLTLTDPDSNGQFRCCWLKDATKVTVDSATVFDESIRMTDGSMAVFLLEALTPGTFTLRDHKLHRVVNAE